MAAQGRFELSLHGLVTAEQHARLLRVLRGLCVRETELHEHEVAIVPAANVKLQKKTFTKTVLSLNDVPLRLRAHVEARKGDDGAVRLVHGPWRLYHYGAAEPDRKKQVTVRSIAFTDVVGDAVEWLANLGYSLDFELVQRGTRFVAGNGIVVAVTRLYRPEQSLSVHGPQQLLERFSQHWLVELTMLVSADASVEHLSFAASLKAFAAHLAGLVDLVQVDHTALLHK